MPEPLADYQRAFVSALYDPSEPPPRGLAEDRFEIYRANLQSSLAGALEEVFEATAIVLGAAFSTYARLYISEQPLRAGDRSGYGEAFPQLLAEHPALGGHRFIAELAAFEWAIHRAHHAADAPPLGFEALLDPTQTIALHPSVAILRPGFEVAALHKAVLGGGAAAERPSVSNDEARIVWRTPADDVVHAPLAESEVRFLTRVVEAGSLLASEMSEDEALLEDLQRLLAWCVPAGLLTATPAKM